jgi:hypothetical protein
LPSNNASERLKKMFDDVNEQLACAMSYADQIIDDEGAAKNMDVAEALNGVKCALNNLEVQINWAREDIGKRFETLEVWMANKFAKLEERLVGKIGTPIYPAPYTPALPLQPMQPWCQPTVTYHGGTTGYPFPYNVVETGGQDAESDTSVRDAVIDLLTRAGFENAVVYVD